MTRDSTSTEILEAVAVYLRTNWDLDVERVTSVTETVDMDAGDYTESGWIGRPSTDLDIRYLDRSDFQFRIFRLNGVNVQDLVPALTVEKHEYSWSISEMDT